MSTRRQFIRGVAAVGGLAAVSDWHAASASAQEPAAAGGTARHTLPPLPYAYDALEPHIDAETMRLHHDIHHAGYVKGLNVAETRLAEARAAGDFALVKHWEREAAFHGSGHFLHAMFWANMAPAGKGGGGEPSDALAEQIRKDFGAFDAFRSHYAAATAAVEGSGWGILAWQPQGKQLVILQSEKHQNLTQWGVVPLLALDVWEHAYYLRYQNRRTAFIEAWWNVVHWADVANRFKQATAG